MSALWFIDSKSSDFYAIFMENVPCGPEEVYKLLKSPLPIEYHPFKFGF